MTFMNIHKEHGSFIQDAILLLMVYVYMLHVYILFHLDFYISVLQHNNNQEQEKKKRNILQYLSR